MLNTKIWKISWRWCAITFTVIAMTLAVAAPLYTGHTTQALDENQCLTCHGQSGFKKITPDDREVSLFVDKDEINVSAHRYIDCTSCHTTEPHGTVTPLNKLSLAEKCGTCHAYQYKQHKESIHGQQLLQGNADVATCIDCHSADLTPHSVMRVLEYNAPTYRKNIADTCGKCHNDPKIMSRYGILEKVYETYMRSFHGKAMQLGGYDLSKLNKATCTNCHGTHDIKATTDPESPIAGRENLAQLCKSCHSNAESDFAKGFLGHREVSRSYSPEVFYTEKFFQILTGSVMGFGFVLVGLELSRRIGGRHKGNSK